VAVETVTWRGRHFPFNAAQTVNILGEIGPLFAMFLVNGLYGITAGAAALIVCTIAALAACLAVLGRPPIMPFIAGTISIVFATLTFVTGDAVWVQIKVTLFNALVALLLWWGLRTGKSFFRFVFGSTFHYTEEGWYKLTRNVALFFLLTAVINEAVRLGFADAHIIALNHVFTGVDIWILFKIFIVMPLTAVFFWWQVRVLQRYRLPGPVAGLAVRSDHLA
jgi:intracellular septation protein